ncbi:MAG: hypothetical protein RLZZ165_209 [Bacteroidota bacterium]|jgi:hypothetical protein
MKLITLLFLICLGAGVHAQSIFSDDFESYFVGDYIGESSPQWTTWSGTEGGTEDAQVLDIMANSGTQSVYFYSDAPKGGPQDLVLPFGGEYTIGTFHYEMAMYVPSGKGAYWNFQANATPGELWAMNCRMDQNGGLTLFNNDGSRIFLKGAFPQDTWFTLGMDIKLNVNRWELLIDSISQGTFSNDVNRVASIDIYPANDTSGGGNGLAEFWVDDVSYAYTVSDLNAGVTTAGLSDPVNLQVGPVTGFQGQTRKFSAMVRNQGVNPITSFDLVYTYNGSSASASITGVDIASTASQVVTFSTPQLLAAGTQNLTVSVSNVNGMGVDEDPADDTMVQPIIAVVPAEAKMVVGEEATGTWCRWCPRGAVYMDYINDTYDSYFAGIAVHNRDPMAFPEYDGPFRTSAYPEVLIDRNKTGLDPEDLEQVFLQQLQRTPTAALVNGANYDLATRTLDVSITYTFADTANDGWRVACVLTEDNVMGIDSGYDQANAYANNSAGPMGGFETKPDPVPAAEMNYNHVARALSPNFTGAAGFPATVLPGDAHTFNYSFVLPASWDEDQIHIVGMLINGSGGIDNGSQTSIAEAVSNGFVSGTPITAVQHPEGPDALVTLHPNPTKGHAWLGLNLKAGTPVSVTISDLQGRSLSVSDHGRLSGAQRIGLDTRGLASGLYIVQVTVGNVVQVKRLVIE